MAENNNYIKLSNGKVIDYDALKSGLKKSDVDKKFHNLFSVFDFDQNEILTEEEANLFFCLIDIAADKDKTLSKKEELKFLKELGLEFSDDTDLSQFIQNFDKIKDSQSGYFEDGSRVIQTTYENGNVETIIFFPDGEFQMSELKIRQQDDSPSTEFISPANKIITRRKYSERAKTELQKQSRDWLIYHVEENLQMIREYQKDEGFLEKTISPIVNLFGKSIDDIQTELIDQKYYANKADLNIYTQKVGGAFDPSKYQDFLETDSKYNSAKYYKAQTEELLKGIDTLKQYIKEDELRAQGRPVPNRKKSAQEVFAEIFNNYCAGNTKLAEQLMADIAGNITSSSQLDTKTMLAITDKLKQVTNQMFINVLEGESFEHLQNRFQNEYKVLYGKEDYTDIIQEKIGTIEGWAGIEKIAIITITQILLAYFTGGSSAAAEGAIAGGAGTAAGAGSGFMTRIMTNQAVKSLIATYGEAKVVGWIQKATKFLMLTGTVAEDIGIGFLNAASSERGITWQKAQNILEQGKSSAKYIYFGGYISGPIAGFVSSKIKTSASVAKAFRGGTKVTNGAVQTTRISADKFVAALQNNSLKNPVTWLSGSAALTTEIGAFALFDLATEDISIKDALSGSADMQIKLKVMNAVLNSLLGALLHKTSTKMTATTKIEAEIQKAFKNAGLEQFDIVENKTPKGVIYSIESDGKTIMTNKDPNMLVISLTQHIAMNVDSDKMNQLLKELEAEEKTKKGASAEVKKEPGNSSVFTKETSDVNTKQTDPSISNAESNERLFNKLMDNPPKLSEVTPEQIDVVVEHIINLYSSKENYLTNQVNLIKLGHIGSMSNRLKSYNSLRDKVKNFVEDKKNIANGRTLKDAFKEVRDAFGARTVFECGDYTKHPEVKTLINAGKIKEAQLRAAELQSAEVLKTLKDAMLQAKNGNADLTMARITNYCSKDGIPILSETQLMELKIYGSKLGMDVGFIKLESEIEPEERAKGVKPTTRSQPSGYTALQVNFETKSGEVIEWQFRGKLVDEFAESEHVLYDARTGKSVPWVSHPELKELYEPVLKLVDKNSMPQEVYDRYNEYLTAIYNHRRLLELGFESTEPKLEDYEIYTTKDGTKQRWHFDKRLEAQNLIKLHEVAEKVKKGEITKADGIKEYHDSLDKTSKAATENRSDIFRHIEKSIEEAKDKEDFKLVRSQIEQLSDPAEKKNLIIQYLKNVQKVLPEKERKLFNKIAANSELIENDRIIALCEELIKDNPFDAKLYTVFAPDSFIHKAARILRLESLYLKYKEKGHLKENAALHDVMFDMLNLFVDNPELMKNEDLMNASYNAERNTPILDLMKSAYNGLLAYSRHPELHNNERVNQYLSVLFSRNETENKIKILNFIKDNKDVPDNILQSFIESYRPDDNLDSLFRIMKNEKKRHLIEFITGSCGDKNDVYETRRYFLEKYENINDKVIYHINPENHKFLKAMDEKGKISIELMEKFGEHITKETFPMLEELLADKNLDEKVVYDIFASYKYSHCKEFVKELCFNKDFPKSEIPRIAYSINENQVKFAREYVNNPDFPNEYIHELGSVYKHNLKFARIICNDKNFPKSGIGSVISAVNEINTNFMLKLYKSGALDWRQLTIIGHRTQTKNRLKIAEKMLASKDIKIEQMEALIHLINDEAPDCSERILFNDKIDKNDLAKFNTYLQRIDADNVNKIEDIFVNYKSYGLKQEHLGMLLGTLEHDIDIKDIAELNQSLGEQTLLGIKNYDAVAALAKCRDLIGKNSYTELSKSEKRDLLNTILTNKSLIETGIMPKDIIPLFPKNTDEYLYLIERLNRDLNLKAEKYDNERTGNFNQAIDRLEQCLTDINFADAGTIKLEYSQENFVTNINRILKNLPEEQQLEIQQMFGFCIKNGKLTGYPKDTHYTNSTADKTVIAEVKKEVAKYLNNKMVSENSQLSAVFNDLIKTCPEIMNQIDGSADFTNTLKKLQSTLKDKEYQTLSKEDKKIVTLSILLSHSDKNINTLEDAAFDAYNLMKSYNLSEQSARKLYTLIETSDAVERFMATTKDKTIRNYRGSVIEGQERQDVFDLLAFKLKEGNLSALSKLVCSSTYPKSAENRFYEILSKRINQIKADDFLLVQTDKDTYMHYAKETDILCNGKLYSVPVAKASEIPDLYAYVHTTEAGYATGGSREANNANLKLFGAQGDDKVICTGYISAEAAALVEEYGTAFIFEVDNDKQYVGYKTDIFSLGKNIPDIIPEYYRDRGYKANRERGDKFAHRQFVSKQLKRSLYGFFGSLKSDCDAKYIQRVDNIKAKLNGKPPTMKALREIDPEFAKAYENVMNSSWWNILISSILNKYSHNEVLVSNPRIIGIATKDLSNIPEEYLIMAQKEKLPIVVVDKK